MQPVLIGLSTSTINSALRVSTAMLLFGSVRTESSQYVIGKVTCCLQRHAEYGHSAMRHDRVASPTVTITVMA